MKKIFTISFKNTIRNKFVLLIISIISLILFLGTIISIYQKSTEEFTENYSTKEYATKMIMVDHPEKNMQQQIDELLNFNHIIDAFPNYDLGSVTLQSDLLKKDNTDGKIKAYTSTNNSLPEIAYGSNFPDNDGFYLVCPNKMYANLTLGYNDIKGKITNKDSISTNNLIGENINFKYTAYKEKGIPITKDIDIMIVGTYYVDDYMNEDNVCYMNENLKKEIYYRQHEDMKEDEYELDEETTLIILDEYESRKEVTEQLTEAGYGYSFVVTFDEDFMSDINESMDFICLIIMIICITLICIFFIILSSKNRENYKLYMYLGYTKKKIYLMNFLSNIIVCVLIFFLSLIISFIYKNIFEIVTYFRPFIFNKYEIVFSINYLIRIFIVSVLCIIVVSFLCTMRFFNKKIVNKSKKGKGI